MKTATAPHAWHETKAEPTRIPKMLSVRGAAAQLSFSRQAIYTAIKSEQLRAFKVLGALRILESDLLDFLRREGVDIGDQS